MLFAKNSTRVAPDTAFDWVRPILSLVGACVLAVAVSAFAATTAPSRPELPRVYIDTTYHLPSGGTTWAVHTAAQLTSALQCALPGDVIVLDAGVTYTGNFHLPAKSNPSHKWIYIISSQLSRLPAGIRISPNSAVYMPKIVSPNATTPINVAWGANYWRLAGIEVTQTSNYPSGCGLAGHPNCFTYQLISTNWAQTYVVPDSITIDRCYFHGDATHDIQTAIQANFTTFAIVDSYVSGIHNKGTDTQAVGAFNTTGPIKILNNYLEAAGENVMFGGSGQNYNIGVPSDMEIQNNYLFKPLSWVPLSLPSYQSQPNSVVVKNAFELKSAQRVLFNGNTIENVWAAAQVGYAVALTVRTSQSGDFAVVNDITFTNNVLKNVVSGFNALAADDDCGATWGYPSCHNSGSQDRWYIANNLVTFYDPTSPGGTRNNLIGLQPGIDRPNNQPGQIKGVIFQHNTSVSASSQPCWAAVYINTALPYNSPPPSGLTYNVWILDNVLCSQTYGPWGWGTAELQQYMGIPSTPDVGQRYYGNVMYAPVGTKVYTYPPHNYSTTLPFVFAAPANFNYQLASPYWTDTSDGNLAGVDMTKLPRTGPGMTGGPPSGAPNTPSTGLAGMNSTAPSTALGFSTTQR
jgi:hypothetical protein